MTGDPAILFLTKYGRRGPSSRYRVLQYVPSLEARGFRCDVRSLHDDAYLEALFAGTGRSILYHAYRFRERARAVAAARGYAAVFVQKELAPGAPPVLERRLAASGVPVVHDIDDAIHLRYEESRNPLARRFLAGKIPEALSLASVVLAGNEYLASYASRWNPRTLLFPTVVDPAKYEAARRAARGTADGSGGAAPVVVWIGTPDAARFIDECRDALREASARRPFILRVVGAPAVAASFPGAESVPWSEETEAETLARSDIGIMPLPMNEWTKGKCGLKVLQYMASGLPVVASPTGGADRIVAHGETGFLARTRVEWVERLVALLERPELRRTMGERGAARVREAWSLDLWAPRMAEVLSRCVRGEGIEGLEW
jgi:glycosyltransferase involved in cell wall biosynthesis